MLGAVSILDYPFHWLLVGLVRTVGYVVLEFRAVMRARRFPGLSHDRDACRCKRSDFRLGVFH